MDTYLITMTFPDEDTADRSRETFLEELRAAGLAAELVGTPVVPEVPRPPQTESADDPPYAPTAVPTTRDLRVTAASAEAAHEGVRRVVDEHFPTGTVLVGSARSQHA